MFGCSADVTPARVAAIAALAADSASGLIFGHCCVTVLSQDQRWNVSDTLGVGACPGKLWGRVPKVRLASNHAKVSLLTPIKTLCD